MALTLLGPYPGFILSILKPGVDLSPLPLCVTKQSPDQSQHPLTLVQSPGPLVSHHAHQQSQGTLCDFVLTSRSSQPLEQEPGEPTAG